MTVSLMNTISFKPGITYDDLVEQYRLLDTLVIDHLLSILKELDIINVIEHYYDTARSLSAIEKKKVTVFFMKIDFEK